ncbi:MAG: outer membrane beta-barrel protein [Chitinispirillaceae bacterium]|nr:outer membrane beta-barrel protein [Chitinispirillaceae bacterium]
MKTAIIFTLLSSTWKLSAGPFTPHLSLAVEGGATRSFLITDSLMTSFFAPTSQITKNIRPAFCIAVNLSLGNYFGIESGMGYRHFGQSTEPTTVLLKNDIFNHDFESRFMFDYFSVPLILKAGIRKSPFSLFGRFGIQPSLLVHKNAVWIIDGNEIMTGSVLVPDVDIDGYDYPLHLGGEAGFHLGKNSIFVIGQYNYGFHDIAHGISGRVFNRSYGATLQYRRMIF